MVKFVVAIAVVGMVGGAAEVLEMAVGTPARGHTTVACKGWASVLPGVKPDVAFLKSNRSERTMTWIGHATVLLQTGGANIITDPMFSDRRSPVQFAGPKRQVPLMMTIDELPAIDVVFISHNHYDHLYAGTVKEFARRFPKATWLVPLGLKSWFAEFDVANVREMDWWDSLEPVGLKYRFVPVQHLSTSILTDEPLDQPPKDLAVALVKYGIDPAKFHVFK